MKMCTVIARAAAAAVFAVAAMQACAAPITISYAGTLTNTLGTLHSGDAFSGSYTFDPLIAAAPGSTSSSSVFDDLFSASLAIGSFSAAIGPGTGLPELQQDNNVGGEDRYALVGRNPVGSALIAGLPITSIGFRLDDTSQTAIANALTLLTNPSLSSFNGNTFLLFFGAIGSPDFQVVTGTLTSLTTRSTVPEPGTLALLGIGAAGLAWRRRRGLRN